MTHFACNLYNNSMVILTSQCAFVNNKRNKKNISRRYFYMFHLFYRVTGVTYQFNGHFNTSMRFRQYYKQRKQESQSFLRVPFILLGDSAPIYNNSMVILTTQCAFANTKNKENESPSFLRLPFILSGDSTSITIQWSF